MRPAADRRRAPRVRPGPLPVRLFRNEGTLIDISETGALVCLPHRQTLQALRPITLILDRDEGTVLLRARIVRSTVHRVPTPKAALQRLEGHIAIEFVDLSSEAAASLRQLIARTAASGGG